MGRVQQEAEPAASASQHGVQRLKRYLRILLGISLLCITVGIVTPGWMVSSGDGGSVHYGLFYRLVCTKSKCESFSVIKIFVDGMKGSSHSGRIEIRRQFCLGDLREQIGSLLAWLLCLITFLILRAHRQSRKKDLIEYWLPLASSLSVAGIIMGETIYVYLVHTDAMNRYDGSNLVFPYAMVSYMIANILVFISVILMFRISKQEVNALRPRCNSSQGYIINEAYRL